MPGCKNFLDSKAPSIPSAILECLTRYKIITTQLYTLKQTNKQTQNEQNIYVQCTIVAITTTS